jgi:class 3 adenylate cyclase/tetratricopeptide (TPR) repeat protein
MGSRPLGIPPTQAERRFLTTLFVDLVGYTSLSEQLDPEDLRVIQRRYQNLTLHVMERFGGFVARYVGDGILVYFGYPVAHGNDAERAVRAALELSNRLSTLEIDLQDVTVPPLSVRIGINTGLVLIAPELLSGGTVDHSAIGDPVNVAARLQAEAPPGGVVISKETFDLLEGQFECRAVGPRPIKGLSREIIFYHVVRVVPGAKTRQLCSSARMVGRESSVAKILARWTITGEKKRCQTILVVGEAGIGKTRLVEELCSSPDLADATILRINCHELFASTPLYPVASFLWSRTGLAVEDDEGVRLEKISTFLDELKLSSAENKQLITSLLGLATMGMVDPTAPTPLLFKQKQYQFVVSTLKRTVSARPTLLWVEDAHWLDASSAELLLEIVSALAEAPLMVVLTVRTFPKGPALPPADEIIQLEQLDSHDCLEIARSILGADALTDATVSRAIESAEGVPLFLEQFMMSLIEEQREAPIPKSKPSGVSLKLGEMMSERLDRRPGGRRIVQTAACIGRSFTPEFLSTLLRQKMTAVAEPLQALVDAEILVPRRYGAEIRFEFRHALLQRIAYESIVQEERRATHGRIVDVLQSDDRSVSVLPEVTAHHLTEAGRFEDAIGAWLKAGMNSAQKSAHVEAIAHLRRGLGLLVRVPHPGLRRQLELNLLAVLIGSIIATEGATSARVSECCLRGLQLCEEGDPTQLVLPFAFGQFTFTNCKGRIDEAESLARLFLSRAERLGNESGLVIGHRLLGMVLFGQADATAAKEHLELSLRLYSPGRDAETTHQFGQNTEVHTKSLLSFVLFCLGDIDEALKVGIDALRSADMLRHPHSTALALTYIGGWVFGFSEATNRLMHEARRLIALSEQHRLGSFHAHGTALLGWASCQRGQLEQGSRLIEEGIAALDTVEFRMAVSGYLGNLADAQRRLGNLKAAEAASARSIELMRESSCLSLEPELRRIEALIFGELSPSEPEITEGMLRRAVAHARNLGFPVFERRCLVSLKQQLRSHDFQLESRLKELSAFGNLARRIDAVMPAAERIVTA